MDYATIRTLHITCAVISITLFTARGAMQLAGTDWRRWRWLRIVPHLNDTLLLAAAITLAVMSAQYPLAQPWLTAKVLALVAYVALGSVALRRGLPALRSTPGSITAAGGCRRRCAGWRHANCTGWPVVSNGMNAPMLPALIDSTMRCKGASAC